jgi:LacI family transcriptional regulator
MTTSTNYQMAQTPDTRSLPRRSAVAPFWPSRSASTPRIGLALSGDLSHWHDVRRGIAAWAFDSGWHVVSDLEDSRPLAWWLREPVDGLIAAVTTPAAERLARAARIPLVSVSEMADSGGPPVVTFDNEAIGRLAADHLLEQGYRTFGFFGLRAAADSRRRLAGFAARLQDRGLACDAFEAKAGCGVVVEEAMERWLGALPPGTGVFAVNDARATLLLDACRRLAIDVPGRLGLLGVGDLPSLCTASSPPLSSICRNGHDVGRAACMELARLLAAGRPDAPPRVVVPPAGVSTRDSTAFGGGDLPTRAVLYIREHIGEPFDVEHLARKLRVSRRSLERAFRDAFGEPPRVRLQRLRAEAALAALAAGPGTALTAVARSSGFSSVRHLRRTLDALGLEPPGPSSRGAPPTGKAPR